MDNEPFELTPAERAELDRVAEVCALEFEASAPRLDVLAVDLELGLRSTSAESVTAPTEATPRPDDRQSNVAGASTPSVGSDARPGAPEGGAGAGVGSAQECGEEHDGDRVGGSWWWQRG